ncbi:MAG: hypothetical protein KGL44_00755 [Sphingomonadales bacterium]|nr:hypothetical protein [Sphingomonadales bacterium]
MASAQLVGLVMLGSSNSGDKSRVRRRSSRRSQNRSAQGDWLYRFRKLWRRHVGAAMAVLTLFFVGYVYFQTYTNAVAYEGLSAAMRKQDVLYVLGKPDAKHSLKGREVWVYRSGDRYYQTTFGSDGVLSNILCTSKVGAVGDCLPSQRVSLGMTEDEVWYRLGKPAVERLDGTTKVIAYPSLGLTLKLEQFQVSVIANQPERRPLAILPKVLRILLP